MKPASFLAWIRVNFAIGALSFGSSGRALLYEEAVVSKHGWMSSEEFREIFTVTQVLPGPNLVNLSVYLGYRLCGTGGAIGGLFALAAPGAFMLVAAYHALGLERSRFDSLFKGISIGSIVLFLVLIQRIAKGLADSSEGKPRASRIRVSLRCLLALGIGFLALRGVCFQAILLCGALAGLAMEFSS